MRLFLAIDLPAEQKKELEEQLRAFRDEYPFIRWVSPENFHISLYFYGEVKNSDKITENIQEVLYESQSGPLHLYSFAADLFIKKSITLYLGFHRNKELEKIVERIKERSALSTSRKFVAHLTLGRYKIPSKQQYLHLKKKLNKLQLSLEFKASKLVLFDSILGLPKPEYKKVAEFPLEN